MTRSHLKGTVSWLLSLFLSAGIYACGADSDADAGSGNGKGSGSGSGSSGGGKGTGKGSGETTGPQFPGAGDGFRPLVPGCGPKTANECTGSCEQRGGDGGTVIRPPATLCFSGEGDPTPEDPSAVIEQVIEEVNGQRYVHIRITFDPAFTDNTYGEGTSSGWPQKGGPKPPKDDKGMGMPGKGGMEMPKGDAKPGHTFGDLTGSDHTELLLTNGSGDTVMSFKVDLISENADSPCGYGTLGVRGGDGKMILGDASDILAVATSTDRNLNGCGYCESSACGSSGDCTVDSPATDDDFTPNPATPNWDYRQVYEVWIALDAFGDEGFGQAYITYTHSSPAKAGNTIEVEPTPCPPEWDEPYCPPGVIEEGGNCYGGGGDCPPNQQTYITSEGASLCTPIPYANYDDMKPCPEGYELDLASEGQFCLPVP
jgi:hypothetical protein